MSTRKLGVALGAAVLLLGMPTSYALAGAEDRPDKPDKPAHQCEDGIDNDGAGDGIDYPNDPDCGSPRDNSEAPEEPGGEEPGGGLPGLPGLPELPPGGGELPTLPELPPGGGELPTLPELPPGGGELPTLPELPAPPSPEDLVATVEGLLPDPPA